MSRRIEIDPGSRFGRWTFLEEVERIQQGKRLMRMALCECECGTRSLVQLNSLTQGSSQGCVSCQSNSRRKEKRDVDQPGYAVWIAMIQRCENPSNPGFKYYGGRGIKICKRWRNSREAFVKDMGPRPDGTTLDRIDNDGDYEPSNCRWSTQEEQCSNKRNNHYVRAWGIRMTLTNAARIAGVSHTTIVRRIRGQGLSAEQAIMMPSRWEGKRPSIRLTADLDVDHHKRTASIRQSVELIEKQEQKGRWLSRPRRV